jgi:hypothetical protein
MSININIMELNDLFQKIQKALQFQINVHYDFKYFLLTIQKL